jgi:hypothetical protein
MSLAWSVAPPSPLAWGRGKETVTLCTMGMRGWRLGRLCWLPFCRRVWVSDDPFVIGLESNSKWIRIILNHLGWMEFQTQSGFHKMAQMASYSGEPVYTHLLSQTLPTSSQEKEIHSTSLLHCWAPPKIWDLPIPPLKVKSLWPNKRGYPDLRFHQAKLWFR